MVKPIREKKLFFEKIVSGGQSGVDRAALDIALEHDIPCGGWCPKGRLAEDGVIAARYPLKETSSSRYEERTEWNVRDSDGTLIIAKGELTGGTAFTVECAEKHGKPVLVFDFNSTPDRHEFERWVSLHQIRILNVAGPRESHSPGEIYSKSKAFMIELFGL